MIFLIIHIRFYDDMNYDEAMNKTDWHDRKELTVTYSFMLPFIKMSFYNTHAKLSYTKYSAHTCGVCLSGERELAL